MYIKQNVYRPEGSPGTGIKVRDALVLIDIDDIVSFPDRDDKGVVIENDIVLKPGRYGITIYMTPGTVEVTSAAEGDTDQVGFTPSIKFNHPGNEQEVREFKANWINRKFVAILRYCQKGKAADLIGSPCSPCKLTPSYTGNNDGNTNEMTVEQTTKGDDIAIYRGNIPMEEPVAMVEAASTTITYVTSGAYQLQSGAAKISHFTGGVPGGVITVLGTAGTAPSIELDSEDESANIMLAGGRKFTASLGSQITFRAFEVENNGIMWIEQSRYEA